MRSYGRVLIFVFCVLIVGLCVFSCAKKKQGKVIITEKEFVLRQDTDHSFVIDAKGKIKNVGDVDVKKVVVTGYCRSCGEVLVNGKWFVNTGVEKAPDQKDIISYLAAGDETEFHFRDVAFMMEQAGKKPAKMPDNMEVVIESFETVND